MNDPIYIVFRHEDAIPFWSYHSVDPGYVHTMASMAWTWTTMRRFQGHLLQKDLLGLVTFPFVSYALCSCLQLHSYPCLNSHVWIVLLGNEPLVELSLELGNGPLHWISFLHPMMILGHNYESNRKYYPEWYTMFYVIVTWVPILHIFRPCALA